MKAQFTPGPWEIDENCPTLIQSKNIKWQNNFIAKVIDPSDCCHTHSETFGPSQSMRDVYNMSSANARLIAAAPELYDILQRLTEKAERANSIQHSGGKVVAEDWSELYHLTNEARAALSSAEGR